MAKKPQYYIVDASALPEVFLKVAEAKRLLSVGEVGTVNEATKVTGISRSAFYKYRDYIQPFQNMMTGRVITFQFLLQDEPGALSGLLTTFARRSANILTINSIIPTNGCALVTISADVTDVGVSMEELMGSWRLIAARMGCARFLEEYLPILNSRALRFLKDPIRYTCTSLAKGPNRSRPEHLPTVRRSASHGRAIWRLRRYIRSRGLSIGAT